MSELSKEAVFDYKGDLITCELLKKMTFEYGTITKVVLNDGRTAIGKYIDYTHADTNVEGIASISLWIDPHYYGFFEDEVIAVEEMPSDTKHQKPAIQ